MAKLPQNLIDLDLPATERQLTVLRRVTALAGVDFDQMEFLQEPLSRWMAVQAIRMWKQEVYYNSEYRKMHRRWWDREVGLGKFTFDLEISLQMAAIRMGIERIRKEY